MDDHRIVGDGLAKIIADEPDITVIAAAATGEEAVASVERDHPDVVLMDLRLPGMSGVEAIRTIRVRDSKTRIVVLAMYDGDEDTHRALEVGAATYLLKDSLSDDLIRVVREVHTGGRPPDIRSRAALALVAGSRR